MMFRKCSIVFLAFLVLAYADSEDAENEYRITVSGRLLCDGKPLQDVSIRLLEEDYGYYDLFDSDDRLSEQHTNAEGRFNITGGEQEIDGMEPYIIIRNVHCTANCDEKWSIRIDFGTVVSHVRRDLGDIEMANVCANVEDRERLTVSKFIDSAKEPEDHLIQYSKLMELRYSANANEKTESGKTFGVSGQLTCEGKPLRNLKVKIWIKLKILYVDLQGVVARTHSDENGSFVLFGSAELNAIEIKPSLVLENVNCGTKCTGQRKFEFMLNAKEDVSIFTLERLDLANACQKPELDLQYKDYDVTGHLTCGEKPLSGVHVALYAANALFTYPTADQRLLSTETIFTGHFSLRTSALRVHEALFLNISGVTCGTKCKGTWHVKMLLDDSLDRTVYDLGTMDMNRVCSTHESGQTINYV